MSLSLVVDVNLPPGWVAHLQAEGHAAVYWPTVGHPAAPDDDILDWARANGHVILTHDLDFGRLLALSRAPGPSVVIVRDGGPSVPRFGAAVADVLRQYEAELRAGALVVLDDAVRRRVRVLPIRPPGGRMAASPATPEAPMNPPPVPDPARHLPPAAAPDPTARPEYEFTPPQNEVIDSLARSLGWVGIPLIVLGVLYAIESGVHFFRAGTDKNWHELVPAGLAVLGAVFFFVLSNWLGKAATAFDRVAHTRGYDISHLMTGLGNLARTFGVLALLVQVYIVVAVILLITSLVMTFTR
ncbi:MAG: DUF5615 family PIN-like protein [Gemmataceae bacterium]|nr:DUF5615 family PIN-like protein [Gemmataceae bacterium]